MIKGQPAVRKNTTADGGMALVIGAVSTVFISVDVIQIRIIMLLGSLGILGKDISTF